MKTITHDPSYVIDESLNVGQHNWDQPHHLALGQMNMHMLFKTIEIGEETGASKLKQSRKPLDISAIEFDDPLIVERKISGEQLLNRRIYNDALLVMHKGELLHESYRNGMKSTDRHVIHSCT
jgi:hypothetical protein